MRSFRAVSCLADTLRQRCGRSSETGAVRHRRALVTDVERDGAFWRIADSQGGQTFADYLVIATSLPSPSTPSALLALAGYPRFVADATEPGALGAIQPDARLLVVGNGLTAADVVASLESVGHAGAVTSISRQGLRSRDMPRSSRSLSGEFEAAPVHVPQLCASFARPSATPSSRA